MKVGIKYCGGCNPRYDRKTFYEEFKSKADDTMDISLAMEDGKYDHIIVLAGCRNACADCSRLRFEQMIVITEYRQIDEVMKYIIDNGK